MGFDRYVHQFLVDLGAFRIVRWCERALRDKGNDSSKLARSYLPDVQIDVTNPPASIDARMHGDVITNSTGIC